MFKTTGKHLRDVTGWDAIDFVPDSDTIYVHDGNQGGWAYVTWLDAGGAAQNLGSLSAAEFAQLQGTVK